MKKSIYVKIISRLTGEEYTLSPVFQSIRLQMNMFKFCSVFDLTLQIPLKDAPFISSQDFIEFYFDLDNKPYQIGVGYIEDFIDTTKKDSSTFQCNGKDLLGQLMNVPFKVALYRERNDLGQLANIAASGEYLEKYNRIKSRAGMVIDKAYDKAATLSVSDLNQKKSQILENSCRIGTTLIYQDRLGRIVLQGPEYQLPDPSGRFIFSKNKTNVKDITIKKSYSRAISHATIFYTQTESLLSANVFTDRTYINSDPRVQDIVTNHYYETLNVSDLTHFAGEKTAEERISQIARSRVRQSNREINQIIITTDEPYFLDPVSKEKIPFELGQVWEIESDIKKLTSKDFPTGTNLVEMVLTGIDYLSSTEEMDIQLQFSEADTLV